MTGELTLRGHILPVGGVVEKILAARRRNIPRIILPKVNQKDLREVPKAVLREVSILYVEDMQDVLDSVLLDPPVRRQRDIEAEQRQSDSEGSDNSAD